MYAPRHHLQFSPHTSRSHAASHTNYTPLTFRPRPANNNQTAALVSARAPTPSHLAPISSDTGRRHCSARSSGYNNYGWVSPFGHPDTDGANPRRRPQSGAVNGNRAFPVRVQSPGSFVRDTYHIGQVRRVGLGPWS